VKDEEETPEMIFERIRRRRESQAQHPSGPERAVGEIVRPAADAGGASPTMTGMPIASVPTIAPQPASEVTLSETAPAGPGDPFPRSATMRLLLRRPDLALGVGLPAAGLLLRHPGTRRLIGAALRLGARPEVQQAVQLSTALRHRARRTANPAQPSPVPKKPKPPGPA
jgi:hypothetical protein